MKSRIEKEMERAVREFNLLLQQKEDLKRFFDLVKAMMKERK